MMDFRQPSVLDFTNKRKDAPVPGFSLDKRDQLRRSQMRKREWRAVIMLPIAIIAVGLFIDFLLKMRNDLGALSQASPMIEAKLVPMAQPTLDTAKALPSLAELQGAEKLPNPSSIGGLDAQNLAWARAQLPKDETDPPMPQRLIARDLVTLEPRPGLAALVNGRLDASADAPIAGSDEHYQRLLLALDEGQFAEVIAPPAAADLVVGRDVQVVGRYIGRDELPTAAGGTVTVPVLVARAAQPAESTEQVRETREWNSGAPLVMPEKLFDDVDDEHALIETRPYYYVLGQVRLDITTPGAYDKPVDLNQRGDDVHQDPLKFRDAAVTVRGKVYKAWEDPEVAQDKPFGVDRAVRALVYSTDYGPITETINGQEVRRNRPVQRLFELSITGDQPLPQKDEVIAVTGRFLKFHAIPVKRNDLRDKAHHVERQSDNVYTYFVVANRYKTIPPTATYDFTNLEIALVAVVVGMVIAFWLTSRREARAAEEVQGQIRQIRRTRTAVAAKSADASATPPAAPASDAPPNDAAKAPEPPAPPPSEPPAGS